LYPYLPVLLLPQKAVSIAAARITGRNDPKHLREAWKQPRRCVSEHIDLYQLHRIDSKYPAEDQIAPSKIFSPKEK